MDLHAEGNNGGEWLSRDEATEIMRGFVAESLDLLNETEPKLIALLKPGGELAAVDEETVNGVFRTFHSIKGTSGMLPLPHITALVHKTETLLDLFRRGKAVLTHGSADLLLRIIDLLRKILERVDTLGNDQGFDGEVNARVEELTRLLQPESPPAQIEPEIPITPQIRQRFFQEAAEALDQFEEVLLKLDPAGDSEAFAPAFRVLHSFKGNCGFMGLADLERVSHGMEAVFEAVQESDSKLECRTVDRLLQMTDLLRLAVKDVAQGGRGCIPESDALIKQLQDMAAPQTSSTPPSPPEPNPAGSVKPAVSAVRQDIRVDLRKLDALINLVGELVIAEAMLTRHPLVTGLKDETVERAVYQLRRVSQDLQDVAMATRMIPLTATFQKMIRLVHDVSHKSGKRVELELRGEETEVDKTVIEQIADPLVHIVRNAIDHGIETSDGRRAAGKPETGRLVIEGRHEGNEVWILVSDDGRGLDQNKIWRKALERGLVSGILSDFTEKQIYKLIFEPGFSTADKVTDISGRGVGMDVVKKNVEKIKGRVDIQNTPGQGCTMILRIPLTLAVIEGMVIRLGEVRYILPLLMIREAFRPKPEQIILTPDGRETVRVRDEFFGVIRLHAVFRRTAEFSRLEDGILVLVELEGQAVCLFCDELLGQQEIVIKGLSSYLGEARGISGCTILGDGEVSLILDVHTLAGLAQDEKRKKTACAPRSETTPAERGR